MGNDTTGVVYRVSDVARAVDRVPHTVRQWEATGRLPKKLCPKRDEKGWRYWTAAQLEALKAWVIASDLRPGKGLHSG